MVAFLTVECDVLVTESLEALEREAVIGAFGFLQAEHVGANGFDEFRHEIDAKPNRVDVPSGDFQTHGTMSWHDGMGRRTG